MGVMGFSIERKPSPHTCPLLMGRLHVVCPDDMKRRIWRGLERRRWSIALNYDKGVPDG